MENIIENKEKETKITTINIDIELLKKIRSLIEVSNSRMS